ncbi:hypothetical protein NDU88_001469 [Pleurodeles waltl]|uniref:Uncharacterized protein n=1 Tax=Pleurodeles waltl TaxID=8319 RepID=A0AAV7NDH7_PLEWA|nr:hypothetical protein NDU88_001469 [Pleurodeles waltl]
MEARGRSCSGARKIRTAAWRPRGEEVSCSRRLWQHGGLQVTETDGVAAVQHRAVVVPSVPLKREESWSPGKVRDAPCMKEDPQERDPLTG